NGFALVILFRCANVKTEALEILFDIGVAQRHLPQSEVESGRHRDEDLVTAVSSREIKFSSSPCCTFRSNEDECKMPKGQQRKHSWLSCVTDEGSEKENGNEKKCNETKSQTPHHLFISKRAMNVVQNAKIILDLQKSGKLFEDPEFPADDRAISFAEKKSGFTWRRPSEIHGTNAKFIKDGFSISDINQGLLGNCWILASVAALTERKDLMAKMVNKAQVMSGSQYRGAFRFRFRPFGREVEIMVDDRLPTDKDGPVYARPYKGEYWVCLLEKALAKLHGCYEALEGGFYIGKPGQPDRRCRFFWYPNEEWLVSSYLEKCVAKKLLIGAGTKSENRLTDKSLRISKNVGLSPSHAYAVTGVERVQQHGRSVSLIRISNPWGPLAGVEWRGLWSDFDPDWTNEQMSKVELVKRADGQNWMEVRDFMEFFSQVTVLHLAKNVDSGTTRLLSCNAPRFHRRPQNQRCIGSSLAAHWPLARCPAGTTMTGIWLWWQQVAGHRAKHGAAQDAVAAAANDQHRWLQAERQLAQRGADLGRHPLVAERPSNHRLELGRLLQPALPGVLEAVGRGGSEGGRGGHRRRVDNAEQLDSVGGSGEPAGVESQGLRWGGGLGRSDGSPQLVTDCSEFALRCFGWPSGVRAGRGHGKRQNSSIRTAKQLANSADLHLLQRHAPAAHTATSASLCAEVAAIWVK
uniref:Calpain catalytic domain-containing protein n=1 Tax=Macrostomum lignano TaxID=282301 RepID=A0A1I8IY87_9PLAT